MKGKTSKTTNPEALKVELEAVQARIYHSGAEGACQPVNRRTSFQERGCRACAVAVHQQLQVSALVIPNALPRLLVGHTTVEAIAAALRESVEEAAAELRPFDAEAFKSKLIDYATIQPEEPDEELRK